MSLFGAANNAFGAAPTLGGGLGTQQAAAVGDKDIEVSQPPSDSISALSFSPQAEFLAVSSWDNSVSFKVPTRGMQADTLGRDCRCGSMASRRTGRQLARHLTTTKHQC